MPTVLRALIACIFAGLGSQIPVTQSFAQSARDIMNVFGAIVQSTMVQAAQTEWRKLTPAEVSCVDQTLRQRGLSLQGLINNGITPSDGRISNVLASCHFQAELQQPVRPRFQPNTEFYQTVVQPSKYSVDKIGLGTSVSLGSASYNEYQCKPSDQFEGFTWCQKQRTEMAPRGAYLSYYSMLHSGDGRAYYLNRYLEPAFFAAGEVESDVERLSVRFRERPRLIRMPLGNNNLTGLIAYWGEVVLEPLDASETARVAAGQSPGVGVLLDFNANPQQSIRQGLPVYRITGGSGFVWAESHDVNGRGRLRFFAIDPSTLSGTSNPSASAGMPNRAGSSAMASLPSDAWRDCQSQDTETRLVGCTKIIDADGPNRIRLADAFDGRCSAYAQKQQYDPAVADCKSAIDLNPKYSYAYANLGATYLRLDDVSNAITALNMAVALKTNFLWSRLSRARAFEESGSRADALKDYQYALLIDPTNRAAKDGVVRLNETASPAQLSDVCVLDMSEHPKYMTVNAKTSSASGIEGAISTISSTAQIYRAKLTSQLAKIDELSREIDASEKKQALVVGSADERKRITNDVQRLTDATSENQSRLDAISEKISEQESKLNAADASDTGRAKDKQNRLKDIRQVLAKLRADRAEARRHLQQKMSERDDTTSRAQHKALQIAEAVADIQKLAATKENAESCATKLKASIEALDQKADELRQRQSAEALRARQVSAEHLLSDLSDFARRNSNLVPLEIGPLVAALKEALSTKDVEKISKTCTTLQERLDEVPEFKRFWTSKEDARQQAAQAELDELTDTARMVSEFIESYVRRNITSDAVQDLMKVKNTVSEAMVTPDSEALKGAIFKAEDAFDRLQVQAEYHDYRVRHPRQSRKSLPATTERDRPLVEGPLDETLILVNESGRAGVIRNLRGDLVFDNGRASLCFPHENSFDAFALSEIKQKIRQKGASNVDVSSIPCTAADVVEYDTIAVNRGLFSNVAQETAAALLNAVDKGDLSILGSLSDKDIQITRNGESIRSLQLENEILKKTIEGYGLVVIGTGTSVICQTAPDREEAHVSLVGRQFDRLQLELGASPKVISTTMDSAFVSAKRGQCGAIYGSSKDLRELITSLQRDKLTYHVLPVWFSPADVDAEQHAIEMAKARELQAQQQMNQKRKDDELRAEIVKRQTDAERRQREERLRREYGVPARGLEEVISSEVKAFASVSEDKDRTHVRQDWPALAAWYRERIREQWELQDVSSELKDYGVLEWKNRVLEAGFATITFKMKHRLLGEHQEKCFVLGYAADREFDIQRDPIAVPCENDSAIDRYKVAHKFSSKWLAN